MARTNFDNQLGISFHEDKILVRVYAPTAKKVELFVYKDDHVVTIQKEYPSKIFDMKKDLETGFYQAMIDKEENEGRPYLFHTIIGEKSYYAVDPYAVAVTANGTAGVFLDMDAKQWKPEGWDEEQKPAFTNPTDAVIYEMHVRDFTIDPAWSGKSSLRGTYMGLVESGTFVSEDGKVVKTGLDHLKELGVTHVHLLPVYDFDGVDELGDHSYMSGNRNWGYNPCNYNAVEGSYSEHPEDPGCRILEFREMVQKFHEAGIRVIVDVVYNHMSDTRFLDALVPGYYFRHWNNGKLSNDSGCGNAIESRMPMARRLILDSIYHWITAYHVDGLRFDLMGVIDTETMKAVREMAEELDPSILLYGEPWLADASPLAEQYRTVKNCGIAAFEDEFRNAIRGDNEPGMGFVNGDAKNTAKLIMNGLNGSKAAGGPDMSIHYCEAHDDYCIWDQIETSMDHVKPGHLQEHLPANPLDDSRVRRTMLANGLVLLSQGIPFFQGGSEMLRTKQGDHNSYKSNDDVNAFHWKEKLYSQPVCDFYSGLIRLRKEHPAFRMTSTEQIKKYQKTWAPDKKKPQLIAQKITGHANGDAWESILVLYNAGEKELAMDAKELFDTKEKKWYVIASGDGTIDAESKIECKDETIVVPALAIQIFYCK